MISLHGYVGAKPELGLLDTGGQVVFVLELARQFSQPGYTVDIVTRRFEDQPEFDEMSENLRVWRIPFDGGGFIRREDMHDHLDESITTSASALAEHNVEYDFINSHYWDAGSASQAIASTAVIPNGS